MDALTDSQLEGLEKCVYYTRVGDGILFASSALFLFDYFLTLFDEAKFLWRSKRLSLATGSFVASRYCTLVMAIISILPARNDPSVDSANIVFRVSAIVALKLILATRTWAIWGRNYKMLWYLVTFALATEVFTVYVIVENIATNLRARAPVTPSMLSLCNTTFGDIPNIFIVPYILTIVYETVILSLSLLGIANWRKDVPQDLRTPLLNTLWKDGVLYFIFMLLLSILNIVIILQSTAPQIRTAGANLQTVLHSAAATRLVTHLSNKGNPRVITDGVSVSGLRFTSHFSGDDRSAIDGIPLSEYSCSEEEDTKDDDGLERRYLEH